MQQKNRIHIPDPLVNKLRKAKRVVVLTGAGISAESGVPTFRDAQTGLWAHYRPEELASPTAFEHDPELVWNWYAWRREVISKAKPNPGHESLVFMEKQVAEFTLITQNIDALHQRAGNQKIIELHGNIHRFRCYSEGTIIRKLPKSDQVPPRCPNCGNLIRPDVVWFGESLPTEAIQQSWLASRACDVFFSIGTSSIVHPAATLPYIASEQKAVIIEINVTETSLTPYASYTLRGPAGEVLPRLIGQTWPEE